MSMGMTFYVGVVPSEVKSVFSARLIEVGTSTRKKKMMCLSPSSLIHSLFF